VRAPDGGDLLAAVADRPGGPELLAVAQARDDVALVGGPHATCCSGAAAGARRGRGRRCGGLRHELVARIGGASASVTAHERFGTALLDWGAGRVDIAERRAESYPVPGRLPEVRPGSSEEDLRRRDFT